MRTTNDDVRIVKAIRFAPSELSAIESVRGRQSFSAWVIGAVHAHLTANGATITAGQNGHAPAQTTNGDADLSGMAPYTDDVIPADAGCPVCGSATVGLHQRGCIYAQH